MDEYCAMIKAVIYIHLLSLICKYIEIKIQHKKVLRPIVQLHDIQTVENILV